MSWTLHDSIDALVTRLRARANLNGIQVEDSWPGELKQLKSIWVDDALSFDNVAGMRADKKAYNEVYTLNVWCDVYNEGGNLREARGDLTLLVGEVFDEIAEEPRLELVPGRVVWARIAAWRYFPYVMNDGRGASCRIEIRISGRRN